MTVKIIEINGYKIIYIKNNKNITSIYSYIKTGFMFENKNEEGISHLIEHLLIQSWKTCHESCTQYWSKKGVNINVRLSTRP